MKLSSVVVAGVVLLLAWLLLWPVPIRPVAWQAPRAPDPAAYPYNETLRQVERLAEGVGRGPEDVLPASGDRLYAGYDDGRVMLFRHDGSQGREIVNTGGRPLGLALGPQGGLLVADAIKGLLQVDDEGRIQVLSTQAEGVAFGFVDDVDAMPGSSAIYFSDASTRFGVHEVMDDVLERGDTGRILRYDTQTGETTVLMRGLHFPNGVALGPDAQYLLVNETFAYRIWRYWLQGEKAGTAEILIDNLPGFPDNLSFNGHDRIWVALYSPRVAVLDALAPYPFLRKIVRRLPAFVQPAPAMHGWVLGLDLDGAVVANLQYAGADTYAPITSVSQAGDTLYLGSLSATAIGRLRLDDAR